MKKNIFVLCFLLIIVVLLGVGCTKEEITVTLLSPEDGAVVTDTKFPITGKISDKRVKYFFYHIENGHAYLGDGKVSVDQNGHFDAEVIFKDPGHWPHLTLIFYLDEDNDGEYDVEIDSTSMGMYFLVYGKSH